MHCSGLCQCSDHVHLKPSGVEAIAASFKTDLELGLSSDQVQPLRESKPTDVGESTIILRAEFGDNRLPVKKAKTYLAHLWEAFNDITLLILVAAAIVSVGFGLTLSDEDTEWMQACGLCLCATWKLTSYAQGIGILLAVVVVSGVTSVQNYTQDKQFESLSKVKADREVFVIRDGEEVGISVFDVVVGDVFVVKTGT